MLISFLVPVYNVENYIEKCINSILSQKGADFEIVLLDDGSTDNSGEICDAYAKEYPDIVRVIHKENEGLLLTRRRGFKEAKGDYVACVDSDDYISSDYLQTVVMALEEYNCDMLMFDYESFYPDGHTEPSGIDVKEVQIYEGEDKKEIYKRRLLKNKYNNMWSKVIKREVVDLDFDYSTFGVKNMCEDAIQSYELYTRAQKIVFLPEALYMYRRNIISITSDISLDYWNALCVSYELGWKYVDMWDVREDVSKAYATRCVSFYCDFLSWLYRSEKNSRDDIKRLVYTYLLEREHFIKAVRFYDKKFLPTKYLRFRNPLIINRIVSNKGDVGIRLIFKIESLLRRA